MIICGTGHRPPKLGGYSKDILRSLIALADGWLEEHNPDLVISGMALGWDTALAIAAIRRGIRTKGYVPFPGQESRWPAESQARYRKILAWCASTVYVCKEFSTSAMQLRNQLMVDDSDRVLALWDGTSGGTGNCIRYAKEVGRPIENLWEAWEAMP